MIKAVLNIFYNSFTIASFHSNRRVSIIIYVVLISLIVDTIINQNVDIRDSMNMPSTMSISIFLTLAAIAILGQCYILEFVRQKSHEIRSKVSAS